MTKKKKQNRLLIPVVLLAVLIAVMVATTDIFGLKQPKADPDAAPETVTLVGATAEAITAFAIDQPGEPEFLLKLDGGEWRVVRDGEEYRANMERVDKLIEQVPGLESGSTATDKADKHATFEVDDDSAVGFKVFTGGDAPVAHLLIGKATPSYSGAFVRISGEDKVYRSMKNLKSLVGFSFQDYCSKLPWEFDQLLAERVVIAPPSGEGDPLEFVRNDGIWQTPEGANGNQNLINEFCDKLSKLRVTSFVDDADPELSGLAGAAPAAAVTVGGMEYQLVIGAKDESQYYAADQDGHAYKLSEYNLKLYHELAFDELTFDDTVTEDDSTGEEIAGEMEPDEGVENGLPSDRDE